MQSWHKLWLALIALALTSGAWADSNIRFVRFSLVTGAVEVQLSGEHQWHPALLDGPVVAGERVRTLGSGRAEIELEHGSTLRLIPNSQLSFPTLALSDQGVFVTTAQVQAGTAFATLRKEDGQRFQLLLPPGASVVAEGDASLRADAAAVTVLAGRARVREGAQELALKKNQQAELAPTLRATYAGAADPWTRWSRTRDAYYEAALHHGVEPGSLSTYVNWGAAAPPMPTYTGTGLSYVGTRGCPWTANSGDYRGWCWSQAQGWYLPAQAVVADASVAASASDVGQTNSVLQGSVQPDGSLGSNWGMLAMPAMVLNTDCGVAYIFAGQSLTDPFEGCAYPGGYSLGYLDAQGYGSNYYNMGSGGGALAVVAPSAATGLKRGGPRMPGQRFLPVGPAAGGRLGPPPVASARTELRPPSGGIQSSRLGFRSAGVYRAGAGRVGGVMGTGVVGFSRPGAAPQVGMGARVMSMGGAGRVGGFSGPEAGPAPSLGGMRAGGGMAASPGSSGRIVH
ncbi:MAG TPA: FecR domain-containing protein [Terriglobales bacterium]|nr:FecR domain-containing protein [Terriglobales bacterium]